LFSCKKEHGLFNENFDGKKYAVTIHVANFTLKHTNYALSHQGDSPGCIIRYADQPWRPMSTSYNYVVMDSNFNVVKTITQDSTMTNMGVITDSLSAGHYHIGDGCREKGLRDYNQSSIGIFTIMPVNPGRIRFGVHFRS